MEECRGKDRNEQRDLSRGERAHQRSGGLYGIETPIPFICECSDPSCSGIIRLSLDEYEEVRANSRHFVNIPGHEAASMGAAVVVERRDGYSIVEKIGRAGEIVDALDERRAVGKPPAAPAE